VPMAVALIGDIGSVDAAGKLQLGHVLAVVVAGVWPNGMACGSRRRAAEAGQNHGLSSAFSRGTLRSAWVLGGVRLKSSGRTTLPIRRPSSERNSRVTVERFSSVIS
jgi:hypothetical protein